MKKIIVLLAAAMFIAGCGNNAIEPVAIDESTDTCAVCNMQVMNSQFATEIILTNDKVLKFDDVGCMYDWMDENGTEDMAAHFVRDFDTDDWIEGEQATYVYNESVKTPMSYNIISFQEKEDAEQFVEENNGDLLTYDDLQTHEWKMNREMKDHHHGHDHEETEGDDGHNHDDTEEEIDHSENGDHDSSDQ